MRLTLIAASILATACTMPVAAPPAPIVAFNPSEVTWAQGSGTATIEGQAFMKTRGGDVKYGAGNQVLLMPYSAQSFDWYRARLATQDDDRVPRMDPALQALVRTTVAGGDGRFKFENLPAGSYLVVTSVMWETGASYAGTQGGYMGMPVSVEVAKTASIIITR